MDETKQVEEAKPEPYKATRRERRFMAAMARKKGEFNKRQLDSLERLEKLGVKL